MKIGKIIDYSTEHGPGHRFVLYLTGCVFNCKNCDEPNMQRYTYGKEYSDEEMFEYIRDRISFLDNIQGITLTGGEPLYQLKKLKIFLKKFSKNFPDLDVWLYTGHQIEEVPKEVKKYCDIIVDGLYNKQYAPAKYRGSSNQKIYAKCKLPTKINGGVEWLRAKNYEI